MKFPPTVFCRLREEKFCFCSGFGGGAHCVPFLAALFAKKYGRLFLVALLAKKYECSSFREALGWRRCAFRAVCCCLVREEVRVPRLMLACGDYMTCVIHLPQSLFLSTLVSFVDTVRCRSAPHQTRSSTIVGFPHHACVTICLLYTSPSPRDRQKSRMPSSA